VTIIKEGEFEYSDEYIPPLREIPHPICTQVIEELRLDVGGYVYHVYVWQRLREGSTMRSLLYDRTEHKQKYCWSVPSPSYSQWTLVRKFLEKSRAEDLARRIASGLDTEVSRDSSGVVAEFSGENRIV
jgi:hypothetical protein